MNLQALIKLSTVVKGSEQFILITGMSKHLTMSELFTKLFPSWVLVVNPTWLFVMIWTDPPISNLFNLHNVRASYAAPYPEKAASP